MRRGKSPDEVILAVFNFTPVPREDYRIGVPEPGLWKELLNSDAAEYGGSGKGNLGGVASEAVPMHGRAQSVSLTLPPLGVLFLQREVEREKDEKDETAEVEVAVAPGASAPGAGADLAL